LDYDPKGYKLLKITDPLGNIVEYTYNVKNQITKKKDKNGNLFSYEYNSAGKPVRVKDGNGKVIVNLSNLNNWAIDFRTLSLETKRRYIPSTITKNRTPNDGLAGNARLRNQNYGGKTNAGISTGICTGRNLLPRSGDVQSNTDIFQRRKQFAITFRFGRR